MPAALVLAAVLPPLLLGLGLLGGLWLARLLPRWLPAAQGGAAPAGEPASGKPSPAPLHSIHVVACTSTPLAAAASPSPSPRHLSYLGGRPPPSVVLPPDYSDSLQSSPSASPISYSRRRGSVDLGPLMRAGASVLSQVMDDLETRSAIIRLMSDNVLPSPQAGPATLLSAASGVMPAGEVHMDEIDLQDCIGKGGYGAVYKASWRQAPVAVKYIVCRTDDHDSLGRAIREVVLSKKMSHPNVVQCYSWTVLSEPDKSTGSQESGSGVPPPGATRRSLDASFFHARQGSLARQQSLRRITELPAHEELGEAESPLPPSPFAKVADEPFAAAEEAAGGGGGTAAAAAAPGAGAPAAADLAATAVRMAAAEEVAAAAAPGGAAPAVEASTVVDTVLPVRISSKQSSDSGSIKSRGQQPDATDSPVIAAVRPANLPAFAAVSTAELVMDGAEGQQPPLQLGGDAGALGPGLRGNSYDEVLAHCQQLAAEICLTHQPTACSSFSDLQRSFLLGGSSRGETQQSLPESEFTSRQLSPCGSAAVTPSAAAAAEGATNNPFRPSRLSRHTSNLGAGQEALDAAEGSAARQPSADQLPVASEGCAVEPAEPAQAAACAIAGALGLLPEVPALAPISTLRRASAGREAGAAPLPSSACPTARHHSSERLDAPAEGSGEGGAQAATSTSGLCCTSTVSLAAWQQRQTTSASREAGPSRPASVSSGSPSGSAPMEWLPAGSGGLRSGFQLWRPGAAPAQGLAPRIPSRLGLRPYASMDVQPESGPPSAPDSARLGVLPPGSPPLTKPLGRQPRGCSSYPNLTELGAQQDEGLGARGLATPRESPRAGGMLQARGGGSPVVQELLAVASRENSRSAKKHQRRVDEVLELELEVDSRTDSFNSEEGFGSPVRNRCGVKSVFELEDLHLTSQEALMVVVMEYCDLGALRKALKRRAFVPHGKWTFQTTYRALLRTAQEIAKGMEYIHDFDIVHGDLKPGNVLLKTHKMDRRGYIAKVSDFGLSRPICHGETHVSMGSAVGTIAYSAPEIFACSISKKPSDVYSFGIMLWEMFYCREVYEGLIDGQICVGVSEGNLRPEFDDTCPAPYRRLAERCWHQDPDQRPPFKEIVRELVQIEVDFRNLVHRQNSRGGAGSGPSSLANSRPPSPDVPGRQLRSKTRAADSNFVRALQ